MTAAYLSAPNVEKAPEPRKSGCTGKVPMSRREARLNAKMLEKNHGYGETYKCSHCSKWHVSSQGEKGV